MKKIALILHILFLFMLFACTNSNKKNTEQNLNDFDENLIENIEFNDSTALIWLNYYRLYDNEFSFSNFVFAAKYPMQSQMQGNICGIFDNCFDTRLIDLLIYSPDKKNYIDIDSYCMSLDENNVAIFEIDQEINLVNIKDKTVTKIAFYGSSEWIEDAFWENNSIVVLLGNTSENLPFIAIFDFENKNIDYYLYKNKLNFQSDYSSQRLMNYGIKIEI